MLIWRSIGEIGLENGAVAIWPEPRSGQSLKPKFGSRPLAKKPLYAVLIVGALFLFAAVSNGHRVPVHWLVIVPILGVAIAWPLAVALDRLNKRIVWVYPDHVLISHARDRTVLRKSDLKQIHVYDTKKDEMRAVEFLTTKGKSTVVGLPSEVVLSEFLATFRSLGYTVNHDL